MESTPQTPPFSEIIVSLEVINRHKLKVAHLGVPVRERAGDGTQDLGLLRAALLEEGWCVCEGCHIVPAYIH